MGCATCLVSCVCANVSSLHGSHTVLRCSDCRQPLPACITHRQAAHTLERSMTKPGSDDSGTSLQCAGASVSKRPTHHLQECKAINQLPKASLRVSMDVHSPKARMKSGIRKQSMMFQGVSRFFLRYS